MATYAETFGGNNYVKVQKEDEQFVGVLTEIPSRVPERERGTPKFMVQEDEGDKWTPKLKGEFDEDDVFKFFALTVMRLKLQDDDGKDWVWDLSKTAEEAFVSAWKAAGNLEVGDTIGGKLIDTTKKPYTWKFKIVPQD